MHLDDDDNRDKVLNPFFKFFIGAFAVMAAAIVPRLVAALGAPGEVKLVGFTPLYLQVAAGFAVIVGIVLVIFEWQVPKAPRESFMVALGIPAVLVGAFNTAVLTRQIDSVAQQQTEAFNNGARDLGIAVESGSVPIESLKPAPPGPSGALFELRLVPRASAELHTGLGPQRVAQSGNVGIDYRLPRYYVALGARVRSQREAEVLAERMKGEFPEATAVKQGDSFLVVESAHPRLSSEALAIAARAKRQNISPTLIRVQ